MLGVHHFLVKIRTIRVKQLALRYVFLLFLELLNIVIDV